MSISKYTLRIYIAFNHKDKAASTERLINIYKDTSIDLHELFEYSYADLEKKIKNRISTKICKWPTIDIMLYKYDRIMLVNIGCDVEHFNDSFGVLYRMNPEMVINYIEDEVKKVISKI